MKTFRYIWIACLGLAAVVFGACKEDDGDAYPSGEGAVTVANVYLEDADAEDSVYERLVEFARLGQTLRLEGEGFGGTKRILVNGYDTYFNTAYVTNTSMILQLQGKTPVSTAPDSVRNTIQFVKNSGTYTYSFTIRAASPQIMSISNTLPSAGETVIVYGVNLQETNKVTLPGDIEVTEITNAGEGEDGAWFSFVMPSGVTESGSITSEGANGTAISATFFNNRNCMILDFDDYPNSYWGSSTSMIRGSDLVADPLASGRGVVCQLVPGRLFPVSAKKTRVSECWSPGAGDATSDWSRFLTYIPATTSVSDLALQFDIYVPDAWSGTGHIEIASINNYSFTGIGSDDDGDNNQVAFYVPWIRDGSIVAFHTTGWQTVTIPLSDFNKYATEIAAKETPTFREVIDDRNAATYPNFGIGFVNSDFTLDDVEYASSTFTGVRIYVDNFRIVSTVSSVVSDY